MRSRSTRTLGQGIVAVTVAAALVAPAPGATARQPSPPDGGTEVGVTHRVIKIGMHAPLTGAAPVPSQSMDQGKDIYFRWMRAKGRKINGRRVQVILRNDNYNPADAVAVCKELVEEEKVFALVGISGADQIQACARYAASVGVPYISPGSTERRMDLGQTFATSMTWPDGARLMTDFMVTKLKARRRDNAIVWHDAPSWREAHSRFVRSMRKRKADVYSRSVPTQANTADATAVVQELVARDIENVMVHVTAVFFTQLLRAAGQQRYHPQWTAVDSALTADAVVTIGCGDSEATVNGAKFFSAQPAFADRDKFDKKFAKAMAKFYPGDEGDAIVWANWAQQKSIARLLRRPGRNLTRKRFVRFAERASVKTGVGSRLRYRPKNHFGADQVHLLKARCSDRRWHTIKSFVSDF
jgi:branched-chain amino acid transport system substrate-binding protein